MTAAPEIFPAEPALKFDADMPLLTTQPSSLVTVNVKLFSVSVRPYEFSLLSVTVTLTLYVPASRSWMLSTPEALVLTTIWPSESTVNGLSGSLADQLVGPFDTVTAKVTLSCSDEQPLPPRAEHVPS